MNKRIMSVVMSALLVVVAILFLQNEKVVEAADNLVLLEKRHPGYWTWLRENATEVDIDSDELNDINIYPVSKMYLSDVTNDDYRYFLKDTERDNNRRLIYFLDGTGIDITTSSYGDVDTNTWTVRDGVRVDDLSAITYFEKPINEVTDIFEYLTRLKDYSFIISVRDDAAGCWNAQLQKFLEQLGLIGGFNFRDSYIAVVINGEVKYEEVCHTPLEYSNEGIYVKSAGYDTGVPDSIICVYGTSFSVNKTGLNIVSLKNKQVMDSVAFDTCHSLFKAVRSE